MRVRDSLLFQLRLWRPPPWKIWASEPELDAKGFEVVVRMLLHFLRGGGVVDWAQWWRWSVQSRCAYLAASARARSEKAATFGMASQGKLEAAEILSPADDGALKCELLLMRAVEKYDEP